MTLENADSPSSTPTAPLKPWLEIARLGQLIIKELDLASSNRVLGRWMTYRVAELMRRVETETDPIAKETAERECQDLIMRLWELREQWPSSGPLRRIIPTLHQLLDEASISIRFVGMPEGRSVGGLITILLRAQRQELRQLCELISATIPVQLRQELQQFLDENSEYLSDTESYLITLVAAPGNLPIFRNKIEAQDYEDLDIVFTDDYNPEESVDDSPYGFAEFKEQVDQHREKLLTDIKKVLDNL